MRFSERFPPHQPIRPPTLLRRFAKRPVNLIQIPNHQLAVRHGRIALPVRHAHVGPQAAEDVQHRLHVGGDVPLAQSRRDLIRW
jgi:hypothetical protein